MRLSTGRPPSGLLLLQLLLVAFEVVGRSELERDGGMLGGGGLGARPLRRRARSPTGADR